MYLFVLGYDLVLSLKLEINLTTTRSFRAEKPLCGNQVTLSIVVVLAVARFLFHYLPIFCQPYLSYNFARCWENWTSNNVTSPLCTEWFSIREKIFSFPPRLIRVWSSPRKGWLLFPVLFLFVYFPGTQIVMSFKIIFIKI